MNVQRPRTVAVIGGGIVGLFTALKLQDRGFAVQLIEPDQPGGRQAASYGNGTWINEGAIIPISLPGLWKTVPGFLLDPNGPFIIRWRHLPRLLSWLPRFVLAGRSWARVQRDIPVRAALLRGAVAAYEARADQAGSSNLLGARGVMYAYRDEAEFAADEKAWALRREQGIACSFHRGEELRELAPELSSDYAVGARILPSRSLRDPGAYCAALAGLFLRRGGRILKTRATGFDIAGGRLRAVRTEQGDVPCAHAVVAAGIGSGALARQSGDRVPLIAERGYHVVIRDCPVRPEISLMLAEGKLAVASTPAGLRLAGQVELAAPDAPANWDRARILLHFAKRMFPQASAAIENGDHDMWMGNRPSTPDALPVIGKASGCADIVHAFGHAHFGMSMSPATARLVADLVTDGQPAIDPAPYSPRRFRLVA